MKTKQIFILFLLTFASSCGIYSFSGVNLDGAETISFKYFDNVAPIVNPNLSQMLYDEMYDRFVNQTSLDFVQRDGDLIFEGKIIGYDVKPMDIKTGETAAFNRLTVKVKVKFTNFKNPKNNFEKTFNWYADFESSQNFSDVEENLNEEIVKKIVDDIFNSSVVNW